MYVINFSYHSTKFSLYVHKLIADFGSNLYVYWTIYTVNLIQTKIMER
jgi:hypothetical protein